MKLAVVFIAWLMAASIVVLGPTGTPDAEARQPVVGLAENGDPCTGEDINGDPVDGTVQVREYDGEWWGRGNDNDIIEAWDELYETERPLPTPPGYRYDVEVCMHFGEIIGIDFGEMELVAADDAQGWYNNALDGAVDGLDLKAPGWISFPARNHNQIVFLDTWFYVENHWEPKSSSSESGEVRIDVTATPVGVDFELIPQADGQAEIDFPPCVGRGEIWTPGQSGASSCSAPPWEHSTSILGQVQVRGRLQYEVVITQTTLDNDDANQRGGVVTTSTLDNRWGPWDTDGDTPSGSRYYFDIAEVQTYGLVGDAAPSSAPDPAAPTPGGDTIGVSCKPWDVWCSVIKPIGGVLVEFFIPEALLNMIEECASAFGDAFGGFTDLLSMLNPANWGEIWDQVNEIKDTLTEAHSEGRLISVLTEMAIEAGEGALQLDKLKDADGNWDLSFENVTGWLSYMACDTIIGIVTGGVTDKLLDFVRGVRRWKTKRDNGEDTGPSDSDRDGSSCPLGGNSFPGETLVLLSDGSYLRIDLIEPGDEVMSFNFATESWEARTVLDQWSHPDQGRSATVSFEDSSTITATDDHRFWRSNADEWTMLEAVGGGDELLAPSGAVAVEDVVVRPAHDWTVWELTVEQNHNFVVSSGSVDVLVHNTKACPEQKAKTDEQIEEIDDRFKPDKDDPLTEADLEFFDEVDMPYTKPSNDEVWAQAPSPTNDNLLGVYRDGDDWIFEMDVNGEVAIVRYNSDGYPDFGPYSEATVTLPDVDADGNSLLNPDGTRNRANDNKAANALVEQPWGNKSPPGYTWHHVEGTNPAVMQLVDHDVHAAFSHSGGVASQGGG